MCENNNEKKNTVFRSTKKNEYWHLVTLFGRSLVQIYRLPPYEHRSAFTQFKQMDECTTREVCHLVFSWFQLVRVQPNRFARACSVERIMVSRGGRDSPVVAKASSLFYDYRSRMASLVEWISICRTPHFLSRARNDAASCFYLATSRSTIAIKEGASCYCAK